MIYIKICYRENGSVSSVISQGHARADVCAAVSTLMLGCGNQLADMKSAKLDNAEPGLCCITDIRQNKPALAIAELLVKGLEALGYRHPNSISIMKLN